MLDEDELKEALVLVFANKQDLPGALDEAKIAEALELHKIKSRTWTIFKTSAMKGEGLFEGLDCLEHHRRNKLNRRRRDGPLHVHVKKCNSRSLHNIHQDEPS